VTLRFSDVRDADRIESEGLKNTESGDPTSTEAAGMSIFTRIDPAHRRPTGSSDHVAFVP
jgi:hypothetical protein